MAWKNFIMKGVTLLAVLLFSLMCNRNNPTSNPFDYGLITSAVIVVNPVINQGSSTNIQPGSIKANVSVQAGGLTQVFTDSTGLVVIKDLPVGPGLPIIFDSGTVTLDVIQEKELYDCVVSVTLDSVQYIFPPVRYPIYGDKVIYLQPTDDIADYISDDNTVIVLSEGVYQGNFEIRAEGVLIFGAWSPTVGPLSIIKDSVNVRGGMTRMRGLGIEGKITVRANNFEAAFCEFGSADISGDNVMLLRNEFTEGQAIVPSSSAILVDNKNIP